MTAREDAIEAGAQALHGDECPDDEHDLCDVGAWDRAAAAVVDAVEPIIRADERERSYDKGYMDALNVSLRRVRPRPRRRAGATWQQLRLDLARADERERIAEGGGIPDYEAEVRERIAQDVLDACRHWAGVDPKPCATCERIAARIARGD